MTPDTAQSDYSAPAAGRVPAYQGTQGIWPMDSQRQLWTILEALLRSEKLTVLTALEKYQTYALSQRIGQIKALGWHVQRRMIKVGSGKAVAEYSL